MSQWIDATPAADLARGRCTHVEVDGEEVLVVNLDGTFYALDNICSHDYAQLHEGELDGKEIVCPLHGARFDVTTGEVLSPPAYEDLRRYEVRVHEGMIQVKAPLD